MNKEKSYGWSSIISEPNGREFSPAKFSLSDISSTGKWITDSDGMISSFSVRIDSFIFIFGCRRWGRWTWHDRSEVIRRVWSTKEIGLEKKQSGKCRGKSFMEAKNEWDSALLRGYMWPCIPCFLHFFLFSSFFPCL